MWHLLIFPGVLLFVFVVSSVIDIVTDTCGNGEDFDVCACHSRVRPRK